MARSNDPSVTSYTPARVTDRHVVSAPDRVIQVERVRVSPEQQSSVTAAIRTGRQAAGKSD
jgi:hypothetical protein